MQTLTGSLSVALMQRSPSAHCVSPEIETGEEKLAAGHQSWARDNTAATTRPSVQTRKWLFIVLFMALFVRPLHLDRGFKKKTFFDLFFVTEAQQ